MNEEYFSFHLEPLTPLFFGTRQELSPYEYPKSAILPSIYTLGGTILRVISNVCQIEFKDIEEYVMKEDIVVRGPYIVAKFGESFKYFVPAPFDRLHGMVLEFELMEKRPELVYERMDGLPLPEIARLEKKVFKPEGLLLVEIAFKGAELGWSINPRSFAVLRTRVTERTSFEMNRTLRTVQHGTLYFRSMIESYTLDSNIYGTSSRIAFGCDVKLVGEIRKKLEVADSKDLKIRFGGEGGMARAILRRGEIPLIKAFQLKDTLKAERVLLAVSHVALRKEDGKLYALGIGEVEWILGRVELVGGWLLREKKFKKHVPALTPGSLFRIKNEKTPYNIDEWYLKLLSTAVPYRGG